MIGVTQKNNISPPKADKRAIAQQSGGLRFVMLVAGWAMIIISPIVGAIPGPGFIILFPIGLALVLKNSRWGKKIYIRFKRKFPAYSRWTDWALRRKGHKEMPDLPPFKEQVKNLFKK